MRTTTSPVPPLPLDEHRRERERQTRHTLLLRAAFFCLGAGGGSADGVAPRPALPNGPFLVCFATADGERASPPDGTRPGKADHQRRGRVCVRLGSPLACPSCPPCSTWLNKPSQLLRPARQDEQVSSATARPAAGVVSPERAERGYSPSTVRQGDEPRPATAVVGVRTSTVEGGARPYQVKTIGRGERALQTESASTAAGELTATVDVTAGGGRRSGLARRGRGGREGRASRARRDPSEEGSEGGVEYGRRRGVKGLWRRRVPYRGGRW